MVQQMKNAFTVAHGEGDAYWFNTTLVEVKATGEQTNRVFSLVQVLSPPGSETPLHINNNEEVTYYVLEGELTFTVGEKTIKGLPGSCIYVPRQIKHKFKIEGSSPARMLNMYTPAGREQLFIEMSMPADEYKLPSGPIKFDMDRLITTAQKYGVEILK